MLTYRSLSPWCLLATLLFAPTPSGAAPPVEQTIAPSLAYEGPDHVALDLMRAASRNRVFVRAQYPDGTTGNFLLDTGANISVLTEAAAKRIGIAVERNFGEAEGIGGRAPVHHAVMESLRFGDATVRDVDFAVGLNGVSENFDGLPIDGLLGNNVWVHFILELDYKNDKMLLHRPGTRRLGPRAAPMAVDNLHAMVRVEVSTAADPPHEATLIGTLDTGASELMLFGEAGASFEEDFTEGLEPILGIGASALVPPHKFLQKTRRIPMAWALLGGKRVPAKYDARWVNLGGGAGPAGVQLLVGHEVFDGKRVFFDFLGGRFRITESPRRKRALDGRQVLLDEDRAKHGDSPEQGRYQALLYAGLGDGDKAVSRLEDFLSAHPEDAEARALLASVERVQGHLAEAWKAIAPLPVEHLVEQGEIVAAVNGLLLEGKPDEALDLAARAIAKQPAELDDEGAIDWANAWVALADVKLARGDFDGALEALLTSARLLQNPDAHLIRRARLALAQGDRHGSLAHLRKHLQLIPPDGMGLWFYALTVEGDEEKATFLQDRERAMAQLHPQFRPFDFLTASDSALGDTSGAQSWLDLGLSRDCEPMRKVHQSFDNCRAWYWSLARTKPDEALAAVDGALAKAGPRSDYLDTKAMVHLARGEAQLAADAARQAARMSPDDVYMLWQAERLGALPTGGSP